MTKLGAATKLLDYVLAFAGPFLVTLALTPLVREFNRARGMIDKPCERRINKTPIPRGGGLALLAGVFIPYTVFLLFTGRPAMQTAAAGNFLYAKMLVLSVAIAAVGYVDDMVSLRPRTKLACQAVVAVLAWAWAGLGFSALWPAIPAWLDCAITVFWILGAVNAFNLIDGLDGLASGLALIATLGMATSLAIGGNPQRILFHLAFAGGLLGFLRYNFNPASVFLGDCGSMFIGFTVATLPLAFQTPGSFAASVAMPFLAMGVPAFDTFLAIVRRTLRRLLAGGTSEAGDTSGKVMSADTDHIHHRILRATGFNQRKAALVLYATAAAAATAGIAGVALKSRAAGLWIATFAAAVLIAVRDMSTVELFDAGRLLNRLARNRETSLRRREALLSTPFWIVADLTALTAVFLACAWTAGMSVGRQEARIVLPVMAFSTFAALAAFSAYGTVWSRAMPSNYARMLFACVAGSAAGATILKLSGDAPPALKAFAASYAFGAFAALAAMRSFRGLVRDFFYAIDCRRLMARNDVSRTIVYGAGLRYRAFRRELVRGASANKRVVVGIIDDDICLRGKCIGGVKILGTLAHARAAIAELGADSVVVAFDATPRRLETVKRMLAPTGVKVTLFSLSETEIPT